MIKLRFPISLLILGAVGMAASVAHAAGTISHVLGDLSARRLTISVTDLPAGRKAVTLGGIALTVLIRSSTRIVATLPPSIGAGTYPLQIDTGPEIDITLVEGDGPLGGLPGTVLVMGNTTDVAMRAGIRKWLSPIGLSSDASMGPVGVMVPGPDGAVSVRSLRVKKFSLDGLSPAVGAIAVSVVAIRDDATFSDAVTCTINAGQSSCTSGGSITLSPSQNLVVHVIHSASEPSSSLAWNFQIE
jgi:hypothetical protein